MLFNETCYSSANEIEDCGHKRKTTSQNDREWIKKSKINPRLSAEDLAREINKSGVNIHVLIFERSISEAGRKEVSYCAN